MKNLFLLSFTTILVSLSVYSTPPCIPAFTMNINSQGDTVCIGTQVVFTNTSDLGGETPVFKQWNFGDASPTVNTENATHTYNQVGTFTVTYNIASSSCTGLMVQATVYVIAPPAIQQWAIDPCFASCNGSANIFINGIHNNYSILWNDPLQQTTPTASNLCEGSYIAQISDNYGCEIFSSPVSLTEQAEIVVEAGSDIFICENDQWPFFEASVLSGGQAPFTYQWEPGVNLGLNFDTILNPILTAGANSFGVYFLTVTDANGCSGMDNLQVSQSPGAIHGTIWDASGTIPQGNILVSLIKRGNLDTQWETYDTYTTASDGMYHFVNLPLVDYIVKAESTIQPFEYMPSYWGGGIDSASWEDADVINVQCGTGYFQTDIIMMHNPGSSMGGNCDFKGTVYLVTIGKTQTEDPIPLIDVVVKKTPPGNAVAYTQTGTQIGVDLGKFWFSGMPPTSGDTVYTFVVNIPGLGMHDNYEIPVAIDDSLFENLNFYVDTTPGTGGIFTYNPLGVEAIKHQPREMVAYPNPFTDVCQLRFSNKQNAPFGFTLFDITGKVIFNKNEQHGNNYLLKTDNLEQGIYIAEIETEREIFRTRILKK